MKNKRILHTAALALGLVLVVTVVTAIPLDPKGFKPASAATDTCSGVQTAFNGTAPASVTPGQTFTLSGINSSPATDYGFTVTGSTLSMSATNASPVSYSEPDSSAVVTGPTTYTSYYPDWTLTATGAAGSQIVISLVQASATVTGVGTLNCSLSATLATVNITSAASSGGGSTGSTGSGSTKGSGSSTKSAATTTTTPAATATATTTAPAAAATTTTPATTTTSTQTTEALSNQVVPMRILVVNSQKHPVDGATVTLDGQLSVKTGTNGIANFSNIRKGTHAVSVVFGKHKISKNVQASSAQLVSATVIVPTMPMWLLYSAAVVCVLLIFGGTLWTRKRRAKNNNQSSPKPPSVPVEPVFPVEPIAPTVTPPVTPTVTPPTVDPPTNDQPDTNNRTSI